MDAYADALGIVADAPAPAKARPAEVQATGSNPTWPAVIARSALLEQLEGLHSTLADVKEGSPTHRRTLTDINAVHEELRRMGGDTSPAPALPQPKRTPTPTRSV
jgi:hypothetical protein